MALAILLIVLTALYFAIKVGREKTIVFNQVAIKQYDFKPVKLDRMYACMVVYFVLFVGFGLQHLLTMSISILVSAGIMFWLYKSIARRSNREMAIKSLAYLLFYGVVGLAGIACVMVSYILVGHYNQDGNDKYWF